MHGDYGLNSAMTAMLEIRRLKATCNNVKLKWVKGHQDCKTHEEEPEARLNNKCDTLANEERDEKSMELDMNDLNLNTIRAYIESDILIIRICT